jgi:hypothetical protein
MESRSAESTASSLSMVGLALRRPYTCMANKRLRKELQQTARGFYELGAIDGKTMRDFESLRVESPKVYSAYDIKRLRLIVERKGLKGLA